MKENVPQLHATVAVLSRTKEKPGRMDDRIALLGIAPQELTESVSLAISALYEKLDDVGYELVRAREEFAELEQLVDVDCVAPVPNRRAFMRRLAWAIAMHERYNHPCSILYFDLNDFKHLNDSYGHAAGDMAIRHVSEIILKSLRQSDFMARLGGDEFTIIMYFSERNAAELRGKKIAEKIGRTPFLWEGKKLHITASFGAYEIEQNDNPETALSKADQAMYSNKKQYKSYLVPDHT